MQRAPLTGWTAPVVGVVMVVLVVAYTRLTAQPVHAQPPADV